MGILTSTYGLNRYISERSNYEGKIRDCEKTALDLSNTISELDTTKTGLAKDSPEVKALEMRLKRLQGIETELEQKKTQYQNKLQIIEKEIQKNQQDFDNSVNRFYSQG